MSLRWVGLAPLLFAATAFAQAPGEYTPPAYGPYYGPAVEPAPPALPGRFSLGLNLQTASFEDANNNTGEFDGGTLAIRYRLRHKVELELTLGGGRQNFQGEEGMYAMGTGTLAAKYRFNQHQKLNWWLLIGVGATTIARHDASDDEIDRAQRPHIAAGIGAEYRFGNFALQLEARAMGLGRTADEMAQFDQNLYTTEGLTGGTLALGASYYFGR